MKKTYILAIITVIFSISSQAQSFRCDKYSKYCDAELLDFDYESQSAFAHLYPGDTIPVKTVLYGGKEYHITVCSEYPDIEWKIVTPVRKTIRKIQEIRRDTSVIYKTDEYGDEVTDEETGEPIVESKEITIDTIWSSKRVVTEKQMFSSDDDTFWKERVKKTKRVFIYVILPEDADPDGACIAVMIGRNQLVRSRFKKARR